ncbi:putative holin-like toxin [Pueribacillus sp. YX66]
MTYDVLSVLIQFGIFLATTLAVVVGIITLVTNKKK